MTDTKMKITQYVKYSAIAIELSLSVIAGALIGYWLDSKLGTSPWFFIFLLICGTIAGFRFLYMRTKKIIKTNNLENDS